MRFTKMHGLGNDYVYVDCTKEAPDDLPSLARKMSDRHFGVGSDGLIGVFPSDKADFCMAMFNADGSEGAMCGNGIRCVGKYVYDKGLTEKTELTIETASGIKPLSLSLSEKTVIGATVDMGIPVVEGPRELTIAGTWYRVVPVSIGNPHAVYFTEDVNGTDVTVIGPLFEEHPRFRGGVNLEFVQAAAPDRLQMRVWERGSGETLACGTGACAAVAAGYTLGLCARSAVVSLPGGELIVRWSEADGHIYLTGPAVTVFEGEWPDD